MFRGRIQLFLLPILIGLPTLGNPSPTGAGGLIRDDILYILSNPDVAYKGETLRLFKMPFASSLNLGLYRPLATLSLRIDFVLSDWLGLPITLEHAFVPHLTNLLIAGLSTVLLFELLRRLTQKPWAAFLGAAFFAVHPARTEAVFWISGRAEGLMALFAIAALLLAMRARTWAHTIPVAACALLSAWSKEQGFVLILLLPLVPGLHRRVRTYVFASTALALVFAFVVRSLVLSGVGPDISQQVYRGVEWGDRLLLGWQALSDYLRLTIWPHPLLNEYDEVRQIRGALALLPAVILLALAAWTLFSRRSRAFFAIALFAVPLLPVLNVVAVTGETFAERFLCLPMAGLAVLVASLLGTPTVERRRGLVQALGIVLLAICAWCSFQRAYDYRSERALIESLREAKPQSGGALRLAAGLPRRDRVIFMMSRDPQAALRAQEETLDLLRRSVQADETLALSRVELARFLLELAVAAPTLEKAPLLTEAARHTAWLIQNDRLIAENYLLDAQVLHLMGQTESAKKQVRQALAKDPGHAGSAQFAQQILVPNLRTATVRTMLAPSLSALREQWEHRFWDAELALAFGNLLYGLDLAAEADRVIDTAEKRARTPDHWLRWASQRIAVAKQRDPNSDTTRFLTHARESLVRLLPSACLRGDVHDALAKIARAEGRPDQERFHLQEALKNLSSEDMRRWLLADLKALDTPR